jgi:acetyl esterase/lipase
MTMKVLILAVAAAMLAAIHNQSAEAADEPRTLDLWPGQPPGETGSIGPEQDATGPTDRLVGGRRVIRLGNVSRPTITLYRPKKEIDPPAARAPGAAVLIAPGGGYQILAWDLEGTEIAEWLAWVGVTGIVLKYRVPRRPKDPADEPPVGPLQDAQRAMSLVRSRAREWGIDPRRIGMLGFSAGGNLTARAAVGERWAVGSGQRLRFDAVAHYPRLTAHC